MPTPQEIRDAVDADLEGLWSAVRSRQALYLGANGRYAQMIRTHSDSALPEDGADAAADQLAVRPHYQAGTGAAALSLAAFTKPYALEVHQYVGPRGAGFIGIVYVKIAGQTFMRARDAGPEGRDQPWVRMA